MINNAQKLMVFCSKLDQFVFNEKSDLDRDGAEQLMAEAQALSRKGNPSLDDFISSSLDALKKQSRE